jgi:hypothetical protein
VYLVNARETRDLPGKKSDLQESQWLMKLHTYGLLQNSFRPTQEIRRNYWRQRFDLIQTAARHIQRMQKVLTEMNLQLANVLSDLSGVTGQAIVKAIPEGERSRYSWPNRVTDASERPKNRLHGVWKEIGGKTCCFSFDRNTKPMNSAKSRSRPATKS